MITIRFNDLEIQRGPTAKHARSWLRKNGLTIRNGTKESPDIWVFDCNSPVAMSMTSSKRPLKAEVEIEVKATGVTQEQVDQATAVVQRQLDDIEHGLPVLGSDLQPFDSLMNFVPDTHLTIDHRGILEIEHRAANITRQSQTYLGFYSMESGGFSSYRVDPNKIYDVVR